MLVKVNCIFLYAAETAILIFIIINQLVTDLVLDQSKCLKSLLESSLLNWFALMIFISRDKMKYLL